MSGTPYKKMCESVQNASQHTGIEKRCTKCGEVKKLNSFYTDPLRSDSRRSDCKKCFNESRRGKKQARRKKLPDIYREIGRREARKRRSTPKGKLNHSIASAVCRSLRGNKRGCHWEGIVGYTAEQLEQHLKKQFKPGMTWENYGTEWHVDHKTPIAAFNFTLPSDIDFSKCWSLKNLQPMWAEENQRKNAKLDKPFQPSLAM